LDRRLAAGSIEIRPQSLSWNAGDVFELQDPVSRHALPYAKRSTSNSKLTSQGANATGFLDRQPQPFLSLWSRHVVLLVKNPPPPGEAATGH
jgi:hypothetical protein